MKKHYLKAGFVGSTVHLYRHPNKTITLEPDGPADQVALGVHHDGTGRFIQASNQVSETEIETACRSILA